jgi:hypothetical protein
LARRIVADDSVRWAILRWLFPPEIDRLPITTEAIRSVCANSGRCVRAERCTLLVFAVVVTCWLLTPLPVEAVGLAGGVALFMPGIRVLTWKEAEAQVEWGGLMMIVAGLSLGLAVYDSGAARWLAWVLLGGITSIPDALRPFVIVLAVAGLHLLFSSNTVTASIIIPILVALATDCTSIRGRPSRPAASRRRSRSCSSARDRRPSFPIRRVLLDSRYGEGGHPDDDCGGRVCGRDTVCRARRYPLIWVRCMTRRVPGQTHRGGA